LAGSRRLTQLTGAVAGAGSFPRAVMKRVKHVREYIGLARHEGADCVAIIQLGKHLRLAFESERARFDVVIPASPSAQSGRINFRAEVRRRVKRRAAA
jgi:hypothetical protein